MPTARFLPTPPQVLSGAVSALGWSAALNLEPSALAIVYGAPGVGKTTLLRKRFRSLILDHGLTPEEVLVVSATRESASTLRDQLLFEIAEALDESHFAVEGSLARTISSVAFAVVRQEALANQAPAPELISGAEQDAILQNLLAGPVGASAEPLWPLHIGEVTRGLAGFRAELRDLIASCQEHGLSAAGLRALAANKPEWQAAALIYEGYETVLSQPEYLNRFDSAGLINEAIRLIEGTDQDLVFRALLIDDAQELTPSAQRLIALLVGSEAGLMCFGDPDSGTLGFRQADPQLMVSLVATAAEARGVAATEIVLVEDPWGKPAGTARVQAKVASLIGVVGSGRQRKVHAAQDSTDDLAESGAGLQVKVLSSKQSEIEWLAHSLRKAHLIDGIPWTQMAVIGRTRQQLDELERALGAQSVPVRIAGAQNALREEYASRELLELAAYLCLGLPLTAEVAERMLRSPFCGLDSLGMRRLRRNLRREELSGLTEGASGPASARNSDELLLELFKTPGSAETLRGLEGLKVRSFLKSLQNASSVAQDQSKTIEDLLWALWSNSGLERLWSEAARGMGEVAVQANRNLDSVVALFAAANRYVERNPGRPKEDFLEQQLQQALPEDNLALAKRSDQLVTLTTPSGLVGRRFAVVAAPQLLEGVWPNLKPRNSLLGANLVKASLPTNSPSLPRKELADELRMFYKTIGAANERFFVSSFLDPDEQVSQFVAHAAGGEIPQEVDFAESALTLRGMAGTLRRNLAIENDPVKRAEMAVNLGRLAQAGVPGAHPDDWYGLASLSTVEPLFEFVPENSLDAESTADNPDRGERITINPSQLEAFVKCPLHWFLNYHGASGSDFSASIGTLVHRALELAKTGSESELWAQVESGWHSLRFETEWLEQAERRRAQKLVANLAKYLADFEQAGGSVLAREQEFEFDLGLAHVRGKVDRIEKLRDGSVLIVDLKTGKSLPTAADAEKNAQLGLYQVAFQNGAFKEALISEGHPERELDLAGAKLLLVAGDSPAIRNQTSVAGTPDLQAYFENLIQESAAGMAMPDNVFIARVSSHCDAENEYGTCSLHLRRAVSYVE